MTSRRYWIGLGLWLVGLALWQVPFEMRIATMGAGILVQIVAGWLILTELARARRAGGLPTTALPYAILAVAVAALVAGLVFTMRHVP